MRLYIYIFLIGLLFNSCSYKNSMEDNKKYESEFSKDDFQLKGTYVWDFKLMGVDQKSIHSFYTDSIIYEMKGKIHRTKYPMYKLSYNSKENKWIGQTPDSIVYVMFFKEINDNSMTIYKRKCTEEGLKEALEFEFPEDTATEDHGWNTYYLDGHEVEDTLPVSGVYNSGNHKIELSDSEVIIDGKSILKMSYHSGERRWVGENDKEYLQIFFDNFKSNDSINLSMEWFSDLELLYNKKHSEAKDWAIYTKIN